MRKLAALLVAAAAACTPDYQADPFDAPRDAWPYFYPQLVDQRVAYASPIDDDTLSARFEDAFSADTPTPTGIGADELRARIVDGLAIGYMLADLDTRPLTVTPQWSEDRGDFTWNRVVVGDDHVIGLTIDYLVPAGPAVDRPGVVGLHGHYDDGAVFLESYLGVDLARRGYVVVAPHFRHMDCGDDERDQAIYLMRDGFTLMGQRVYEALLALKFLRGLEGVDPARVGLAAHSGGSSTANLLVRISDWPAAVVTDFEVEYRNACGGQVHCETVPALLPYAGDINDQQTLAIPHLRIDYGYHDQGQRGDVLAFFAEHLGS